MTHLYPAIISLLCALFPFAGYGTQNPSADTIAPIDRPAVVLPTMTVKFSPAANLLSVTSRYRQASGTPPRTFTFTAKENDTPLLPLFTEADNSRFTRFSVNDTQDSEVTATFSNDSQSVVWHFPTDGYSFSVTASGISLPDSLRLRYILPASDASGNHTKALFLKKHHIGYSLQTTSRDNAILRFGIRNHFWTLLVKPSAGIASFAPGTKDETAASIHCTAPPSSITIYAGPVEYFSLKHAGHECTHLLYPLWFWMRWLSVGLLHLFTLLFSITGNTVVAIILLSLCVKLLIAPLYTIASHWQKQVNREKSLLEPRLAEINKTCKGEEHTRRVLALHKELGISPLYALKSLLSAAIQIPVFFAAYHMLSEHIALSGIPFLWIDNLAEPDHLFTLPFSLPLFGRYFNILPFFMTSITIATSYIHSDSSLSEELHLRQQRSLFIMAALFFFLLYTSPAGMLLYWTMNNLFALAETIFSAVNRPKSEN